MMLKQNDSHTDLEENNSSECTVFLLNFAVGSLYFHSIQVLSRHMPTIQYSVKYHTIYSPYYCKLSLLLNVFFFM